MKKFTRNLYKAARLANKITMWGEAASGRPTHLIKHFRNKFYFRLFGRFLK